ncbi:class I SAM-dependent methyltransferase [Candidatus Woesearchaeota archaeon]|nr:class I SAM-dependent methyltransferase [Candidatus Woesearchaeota archaeon]
MLKVLAAHAAHFTGLDYSRVQFEEAARNTAKYRDKTALVLGDARRPPLPYNWYDLVIISYNTINSLNEPSGESQLEVLGSVNQLLVPDGRLIVTTWSENALDVQLEHCASVGFPHVVETTDDYVHVRSDEGVDVKCGRSSPQKLEALLGKTGFKGKIERLTDYSYACLAVKSA